MVHVAGVVAELKIKRTRRGDKMATVKFEDLTGSVEVVIFPDLFNTVSPLLKGDEALLVTGTAEVGESSAKILAKEIVTLKSLRMKHVKSVQLTLKSGAETDTVLQDLKDIVFKYPGDCRMLFTVERAGGEPVNIAAHSRFNVLPCEAFIEEVETVAGNGMCRLNT